MNSHLDPSLEHLLERPAQERITSRWLGIFFQLDQVNKVLKELHIAARQPDHDRQMNLVIIGESGVGKSAILKYYVAEAKRAAEATNDGLLPTGYANIPAIRVSVPVENEADFYVRILAALGRKDRLTRPVHQLAHDAVELMRRCQVRLPIFDEFHNSSPEAQSIRVFAATLKDVGATLARPLVLAGTERARRLVDNDPELATRCYVVEMNAFSSPNQQFDEMLYNFETQIPLRHASYLFDDPIRTELFELSQGLIGNVANLLQRAAEEAIESGEEKITLNGIRALPFAQTLRLQRRQRRG